MSTRLATRAMSQDSILKDRALYAYRPMGYAMNTNPPETRLQRHADSVHRGVVDPSCPACREIQERYGVAGPTK